MIPFRVKLSFIIPAHNEAAALPSTLASVHAAACAIQAVGSYEVIVVDDASTDATATIARAGGARVVSVALRKIAAVRNAGVTAREGGASGDVLVFLDADTQLPAATLWAAVRALEQGAVGGGAAVRADRRLNPFAWLVLHGWNAMSRLRRWAAGCFIFVRRDVFERIGGFDERYFATEELDFSDRVKARGRFVILREPVVTSARKMAAVRAGEHARLIWRWVLRGRKAFERREGLDLWYDPDR